MPTIGWKNIKSLKGVYININRDITDAQDRRQDAYLNALEKNLKKKPNKKRPRIKK